MSRRSIWFNSAIVLLIIVMSASTSVLSAPATGGTLTSYLDLWGYEGIPTLRHATGQDYGSPPPVADYVDTHCRYINLKPSGSTFLRYPLHLPNGANINKISLYVADYTLVGTLGAYFQSRPWNSSIETSGVISWANTDNISNGAKTMNLSGLNVDVNNQTTQYWIDVAPNNNSGTPADAGALCVYGIQVTYTIDGAFLPLIQKGY